MIMMTHIAIPNRADLEETRTVEESPAQHTQDGDHFETCIEQVEEMQESTKDRRLEALHSYFLKICPTAKRRSRKYVVF